MDLHNSMPRSFSKALHINTVWLNIFNLHILNVNVASPVLTMWAEGNNMIAPTSVVFEDVLPVSFLNASNSVAIFKPLWFSLHTPYHTHLLVQVCVGLRFVYNVGLDCKSPVLWINQCLKWSGMLIYLDGTVFQCCKSYFCVHLPLHAFWATGPEADEWESNEVC